MAPPLQAYGMKRLFWTLCIAALVQPGSAGQGLPDFSGTWTMDLSRSEAAAIAATTFGVSFEQMIKERN